MSEPGRITVSNDELVTVRDAMRTLNQLVDKLDAGEAEKYVLMRGTRMVAVLQPLHVVVESTDGLRGRDIADAAYEAMSLFGWEAHYDQIYKHLIDNGQQIAGRDPRASLLAALSRDDRFEAKGARSGIYRLASGNQQPSRDGA